MPQCKLDSDDDDDDDDDSDDNDDENDDGDDKDDDDDHDEDMMAITSMRMHTSNNQIYTSNNLSLIHI